MTKQQVVWHIKVEDNIRYFHPSYRALSEEEVKRVPANFWYPDPVHLIKPENK